MFSVGSSDPRYVGTDFAFARFAGNIITSPLGRFDMSSYPNAAKFCAELRGATGRLDCSFTSLHACHAHVRAGGGGRCHRWIGGKPVS